MKFLKLKKKLILFTLSLLVFVSSEAQTSLKKQGILVPHSVCFASGKTEKSYIPPQAVFLQKSTNEKKSDIIVSYSRFPAEAKTAFEYAVNIWEHIIDSEVPIYLQADWRTIYDDDGYTNTVLAHAGPSDFYANFENAPRKDRFYPICIVERITKTQVSDSSFPDIDATFNKEIKWYFGTDGNTPSLLYDFVTVALHEIGHGLGFTGFFYVTSNKGFYGREGGSIGDASAFDIMVVDSNNKKLTDTTFYDLATSSLYNALVSQSLYSNSPSAQLATPGKKIRLYAPSPWEKGSSIYHLNDSTYNSGNENSLMTHAIGKGEAIHDPGPITIGILEDIGWKMMKLYLDKPSDIETPQHINFGLSVVSDIPIDKSKLFLFFSTDSFKTQRDSVLLTEDTNSGQFRAVLVPDQNTKRIDYFVSATDLKNRVFKLPAEAPDNMYSVFIGPDNQDPVINHTPPPYFVLNGDEMKISAIVTDNLGIDTVYAEFSVNGVPGVPFGLNEESSDLFSGVFPVLQSTLNDGDVISYRIWAKDASEAKNVSFAPATGNFSFTVEKIFNPISGYFNNFDSETRDFIISDFKIYTAEKFQNPSLHSPHPYPSPKQNNSSFDFSTMLKYPIVINSNVKMSFDEVVLVEPGEVLSKFGDDDFYDYVIIEGSKDNGKTWLPLADGYDSRSNTIWETNYNKNIGSENNSKTVGSPDWYINREINLVENGNFKTNDTILIRFRLYSDPYANGWGWTIDNLSIQNSVGNSEIKLHIDEISVYPNPSNDFLNIKIKIQNPIKNLSIELYNAFGQKLESSSEFNIVGEFETRKNISQLPSGIYFVKIQVDNLPAVQKKILRL